jgi:RimJ/RimL family protein N-acetyltransferase
VRLGLDYPVATARLRLRPVTVEDADALLSYRSLPESCRYVPFEPMDEAEVARRLAQQWSEPVLGADNSGLFLGVALADGDRVIGDLTLFTPDPEHRSTEIGWMLDPAYSGQGYATEAVHALLHLAFDVLGLRRVTARIDTRNESSLRLSDRLGMRREAHLIENEWFKGGWSDEIDTAMLDREWAAQHAGAADAAGCRWPAQPG